VASWSRAAEARDVAKRSRAAEPHGVALYLFAPPVLLPPCVCSFPTTVSCPRSLRRRLRRHGDDKADLGDALKT
jgi:hypothetical protein